MANTILTPVQPIQYPTPIASIIIGLLMLAILGLLFFFYGLPAIQSTSDTTNNQAGINVTVPTPNLDQGSSQGTPPSTPY